jgi:hypothetical protein
VVYFCISGITKCYNCIPTERWRHTKPLIKMRKNKKKKQKQNKNKNETTNKTTTKNAVVTFCNP